MMDGIASEIKRDASGRFVAGQSGNPAGKLPGTRNRKTVLMEALRDGEGEAAARVVIEKALAGDAVAARFVVALISPRPRGRTIHLEMPAEDDCNVVTAFNVTLRALCNAEITPEEAVTVSRFLDGRRRTLQAWQLEERLTSYGRTIPGDPEWAPDDDDDDDEDEGDEADEQADDAEDEPPAVYAEPAVVPAAPVPPAAPAPPASFAAPNPVSLPSATAAAAPPPPSATSGAAAQSGASLLQSACNFRSPGTIRDMLSTTPTGFDAALAASIAQRLRAGSPLG
ncbi:MAG: hypothetical protein JWL84_6088 [Rhodospirillales bacterium]|jgi:hypothetical protein|nr:hypothetical protein [Rhodospirillales bacterium]